MASSLVSFSMLISLAFLFLFIAPSFSHDHEKHNSKDSKLKNICSNTSNSHLCTKLMNADSRTAHANNRILVEVAVDLAYNKAKDIHGDLISLYKSTDDSKLKGMYHSCSKNYHDAMRNIGETSRLFKDRDYKRMSLQVKDAVDEVRGCMNELEESNSDKSDLKKRTKEFELLCEVVKVATKNFKKDD